MDCSNNINTSKGKEVRIYWHNIFVIHESNQKPQGWISNTNDRSDGLKDPIDRDDKNLTTKFLEESICDHEKEISGRREGKYKWK